MTVKVTLEFPNTDAAIVALGRLAGAAVAAPNTKRATEGRADKAVASTQPPATENKRRPGRPPRQSAEGAAVPAVTPAAAPKANDPATAAQSAGPETPGTAAPLPPGDAAPLPPGDASPGAPVASLDDVAAALASLFNSKPDPKDGLAFAGEALAKFGVSKGRDLKPEDRAAFIAHAKALLGAK